MTTTDRGDTGAVADASTVQKRLAIGLFGMSFTGAYKHWYDKHPLLSIDYRQSLDNYRSRLFKPFEEQGYAIDVYCATEKHDMLQQMAQDYGTTQAYTAINTKPAINDTTPHIHDTKPKTNVHHSRNIHVHNVLQLINTAQHNRSVNDKYDLVLLTRFDLLFKQPLTKLNIDYNKFNVAMRCEKDPLIDDNLYIFPAHMTASMLKLTRHNIRTSAHHLRNMMDRIFLGVNFLVPGNYWVWQSPIYNIVRLNADTVAHARARTVAVALYGPGGQIDASAIYSGLGLTASDCDVFYATDVAPVISECNPPSLINTKTVTVVTGDQQQITHLVSAVITTQTAEDHTYQSIVFCNTRVVPCRPLSDLMMAPMSLSEPPFTTVPPQLKPMMMVASETGLHTLQQQMFTTATDAASSAPVSMCVSNDEPINHVRVFGDSDSVYRYQ